MFSTQKLIWLIVLFASFILPSLLSSSAAAQICNRTDRVESLLLTALNVTDCNDVNATALNGITGTLNWNNQSIPTLTADDLVGLSSIDAFDLSDNTISSLVSNVLQGTSAALVSFAKNNISSIASNALVTGNLPDTEIFINLSGNALTSGSMGSGFLNSLKIYGEDISIDLSNNSITTLFQGHLNFSPKLVNLSHNQIGSQGNFHDNTFDYVTFIGGADGYYKTIDLSHNQLVSFNSNSGTFFNNRWGYIYLSHNKINNFPYRVIENSYNLRHLDLGYNQLTSFNPESIHPDGTSTHFSLILDGNPLVLTTNNFNKKKLTDLYLRNASITAIPSNTFAGVTNVNRIFLNDNQISSLPSDAFANITGLDVLYLSNNSLSTVSNASFGTGNSVQELYLNENVISTLQTGFASQLTQLTRLDLSDNALTILQSGEFNGLTATDIDLSDNSITFLANNLLSSHTNPSAITNFDVSGNPLDNNSWQITNTTWVEGASNSYTLTIGHSLPETITIDLVSATGILNASAITIAAGSTSSSTIAWTPLTNQEQTHIRPTSPNINVASLGGHITVAELGQESNNDGNVCARNQPFRDLLVNATGAADCSDITIAQLTAITDGLNLTNLNLSQLGSIDLDYLFGVNHFDLSNNHLTTLIGSTFTETSPTMLVAANNSISDIATNALVTSNSPNNNIVYDLSNNALNSNTLANGFLSPLKSASFPNKKFDFSNNNITTLAASYFDVYAANLNLSNNKIVSFPADTFDNMMLTGHKLVLDLGDNLITALPSNFIANGNGLTQLFIKNNLITSVASDALAKLTDLTRFDLSGNQLASVPQDLFANLSVTDIDLSENQLTSLPKNLFIEHLNPGLINNFNISGNSLPNDSWEVTDGVWQENANGSFTLQLTHNVPGSSFTVTSNSGQLMPNAVTIPSNSKSSTAVEWVPNQIGDSVNIQGAINIPALGGHIAVDSYQLLGICNRTDQVKTGILTALSKTNCATVAIAELMRLSDSLDFSNSGLGQINTADLTYLNHVAHFDFSNNNLSSLVNDRLLDINPDSISFAHNDISVIERYALKTGTTPNNNAVYNLSNNAITSATLSTRFLNELKSETFIFKEIDLSYNNITSLQRSDWNVFAQLINLSHNQIGNFPSEVFHDTRKANVFGTVDLSYNKLTSLAQDSLAGETYQNIDLSHNQITTLAENALNYIERVSFLDLRNNQIADFNASAINQNAQRFGIILNLRLDQNPLILKPNNFAGLSIDDLSLNGIASTNIPALTFTNIDNLVNIYLNNGAISTLSADAFTNATGLTSLYLSSNSLTTIPADAFGNGTSLTNLYLNNNQISQLDDSFAADLTDLVRLDLSNNSLSTLQAGALAGLTATDIDLSDNSFTSLPINLLLSHANPANITSFDLTGNPLANSWEITNASWVEMSNQSYRLELDHALPESITVALISSNGALSSNTVTIAAGNTTSPAVVWTPFVVGTDTVHIQPVDANISIAKLSGYITLSEIGQGSSSSANVCARNQAVIDLLLALTVTSDCADITIGQLATITGDLNWSSLNLTQLSAIDLNHLLGVTHFDLSNNSVSSLSNGIFNQTAAESISLAHNNISTISLEALTTSTSPNNNVKYDLSNNALTSDALSVGFLAPLSSISHAGKSFDLSYNNITILRQNYFNVYADSLNLSHNQIITFPADILAGMVLEGNALMLDLSYNSMTQLPAEFIANGAGLSQLWLHNNQIASVAVDAFKQFTDLNLINLSNNQISSLPLGLLDNLSMTNIDLSNNSISSLPISYLSNHSNPSLISNFDVSGNQLINDSWEITTAQWQENNDGTWTVQLGHSLPMDLTFALSSATGTLNPSSITIAAGSINSQAVQWTKLLPNAKLDIQAAVDRVDIPQLSGYIELSGLNIAGVCDRSTPLPTLLATIFEVTDCGQVTIAQMLQKTGLLDLSNQGIDQLTNADLDDLANINSFDLSNNNLTTLVNDVLSGIDSGEISLAGNNISVIEVNALRTISSPQNSVAYDLSNNAITSDTLATGFLNTLKAASHPNKTFDLSYNNITTLNENHLNLYTKSLNLSHNQILELSAQTFLNIRRKNAYMTLDLSHNLLTNIAAETIFGETYETVDFSHNQINSLDDQAVIYGERIKWLDLGYNQIADFNASAINQNAAKYGIVMKLILDGNPLTLKPDNFAGLSIDALELNNISAFNIPALTFAGIDNLVNISLSNSDINQLSADAFTNATGLLRLYLDNNFLATIPADAFGNGTDLIELYLNDNRLFNVADGFAAKLTDLQLLDLSGNNLNDLQASYLQGLTATAINISDNLLTQIPINLLSQHYDPSSITSFDFSGNPMTEESWEITTLDWQENTNGSFFLQLGHSLPADITLNLESTTGALNPTTIILPAGSINSPEVIWTQTAEKTSPQIQVTVDQVNIEALSGYINIPSIQTFGICDRTLKIQTLLLAALGESSCYSISKGDLYALSSALNWSNQNINLIGPLDLTTLPNVSDFVLSGNNLTALADDILQETNFNSISFANNDIAVIATNALVSSSSPNNNVDYNLSHNAITSATFATAFLAPLKSASFTDKSFDFSHNNITVLDKSYFNVYASLLNLSNNQIATFPADAFSNLLNNGNDIVLDLSNNQLTALATDMIENGMGLTTLLLNNNQIASIAPSAFSQLPDLQLLQLRNNQLASVQADQFAGLRATQIDLSGNNIAALPLNLLQYHNDPATITSLDVTGNPADDISWEITTAQWEQDINGSFFMQLGHSVPTDIMVNLTSTTGTLSPTMITIAAGSTTSPAVEWTASSNGSLTQIQVNIDQIEVAQLNGYIAIPALDFTGICDRTAPFPTLILNALGQTQCQYVSLANLSEITSAQDWSNQSINTITADDLAGLFNITTINFANNAITELVNGTFSQVQALTLDFSNNNISKIQAEALQYYNESLAQLNWNFANNAITADTFATGFLTNSVDSSNALASDFDFSHNQITQLETPFFETVPLATLDLSHNLISTLQGNSFSNVDALTQLDLGYNQISDFNANSINQNPNSLQVQLDLVLDGNPLVLKANNFAGLELNYLYLRNSNLTTIPADTFATATNIKRIFLTGTNLTTLESGAFSSAAGLDFLYLNNNQISSIPVDAFGTISSLRRIYLGYNNVTAVPENAFSNLTNLQTLSLDNNQLTEVPVNVFGDNGSLTTFRLQGNSIANLSDVSFSEYTALEQLNLGNNQIATLTAENFKGMTATSIGLYNNQLSSLPLNLLLEHNNPASITAFDLSGNPVADTLWQITPASWQQNSANGISLRLGHSLPQDISFNITSSNGNLSATEIVIAAGNTNSAVISWTTIDANQEVSITPALNQINVTALGGYITIPSYAATGVCDRNVAIRTALENSLNKACNLITATDLASITGIVNWANLTIDQLTDIDLVDLINVDAFDLSSNTLTVLADNILLLTNASSYSLANNNISVIAANALLTNSSPNNNADYNLSNNAITSTTLSSGFLNGLKSQNFPNKSIDLSYNNITTLNNSQLDIRSDNLNLSHNQITNLPATVFLNTRQSGHDMVIDLSYNQLTSIAAETFFGETVAQVDLSYNQIDTLATDFVSFGEDLTSLDLGYNLISDFNASSIHQNRFNLNVQLNLTLDGNPLVLKANNFAGLDLDYLYLRNYNLTTIPVDTFAGATNINRIFLTGTNLTALEAGSFSSAPGLDYLYLNNNQIADIAVDAFGTSSTLRNIYLGDNNLTAVPENTFSNLMNLQTLSLNNNQLTAVPENILGNNASLTTFRLQENNIANLSGISFSEYTALAELNLADNAITELTSDTFAGLTATKIYLADNQISSLPVNLLSKHNNPASITSFDVADNGLTNDSWEITNASWIENTSNSFSLAIDHPLPIDITVPLSSGNGDLNATSITITKGETISNVVLWTPSEGVTSSAHFIPGLTTYQIPQLSGYISIPSFQLFGACSRTQQVVDTLLQILNETDCSNVSSDQLQGITGTLALQNQAISSLSAVDFVDLSAVDTFQLDNNSIATLLDFMFNTTNPATLSFANNNISIIPANALFTSVTGDNDINFNLSNNAITADTLASGFLTAGANQKFVGGDIDLSSNQITAIQAAAFTDFNPAALYLHNNSISSIDDAAFSTMPALQTLSLANNQLANLSAETFSGLSATHIDLSNNNITSLPLDLLINHTDPATINSFDLSGNTLETWQITQANWQKLDVNEVMLTLPHTLPVDVTVSLSSTTGVLNPSEITILAGETSSEEISWTGAAGNALEIIPNQTQVNISILSGYVSISSIAAAPSFFAAVDTLTVVQDHAFTQIQLPNATGGDGLLTYTLVETNSTELPDGLVFDPINQQLSGSLDTMGNYSLIYTVADEDSDQNSIEIILQVLENLPPVFPNNANVTYQILQDESVNITLPLANDANGAIVYSIDAMENLPAGLSFQAPERNINGSTNALGTYALIYTATDSLDGDSASLNITIQIDEQLSPQFDVSGQFDNMTMRQDADDKIQLVLPTVSGGNGELIYSFTTDGNPGLPDGLIFNQTTQMIEGEPTVFGVFNITVVVEDSDLTSISDSDSFSFTLVLIENLGTVTDLQARYIAVFDQPISFILPAGQGGTPSYVYELNGSLPSGVEFDVNSRILSGRSSNSGSYNLTYRVIDQDQFVFEQHTVLTISHLKPEFIALVSDIQLQPGQSINMPLPAATTEGQGEITYSMSGAPAGITFNASSRQLSGSTAQLGTYKVTYTAIDIADQQVEQSFDIIVTANTDLLQDIMWRQALAIADQTVNSVKKRFALVNQHRLPYVENVNGIGANFQVTETNWLGLWLNSGSGSLANKDNAYSWDGSTGVIQIGVDFSGKDYLVGLTSETVSTSSSFTVTGDDIDYTGNLDISGLGLLSLYGGYYQPKYSVWAISSSGSGSADLSTTAEGSSSTLSTGVDYSMSAFGGSYKLDDIFDVGFEGITSAALDFSDNTISSVSSNSASRNKFFGSIDFGKWTNKSASQSTAKSLSWSPKLALALRSDSGEGSSSSGLETTVSVQVEYSMLNFEFGTRNFASGDFSESGQWLSFNLIPTGKTGLNFTHRQQFGNSGSAENALLSDRALTDVVSGMRQSDTVTSISTIAYGWNIKAGSLQLYSKGESSYADSTATSIFDTKSDIQWEHIGLSFDSASSKYSWNAEADPTAISFKAKIRY